MQWWWWVAQKRHKAKQKHQVIGYNDQTKLIKIFVSFIGGGQGKGEFTMEYLQHGVVPQDVQMQLVNEFKQARSSS